MDFMSHFVWSVMDTRLAWTDHFLSTCFSTRFSVSPQRRQSIQVTKFFEILGKIFLLVVLTSHIMFILIFSSECLSIVNLHPLCEIPPTTKSEGVTCQDFRRSPDSRRPLGRNITHLSCKSNLIPHELDAYCSAQSVLCSAYQFCWNKDQG